MKCKKSVTEKITEKKSKKISIDKIVFNKYSCKLVNNKNEDDNTYEITAPIISCVICG